MKENVFKGLIDFIIKDVSYEFFTLSNQIYLNGGNGLITKDIRKKVEEKLIEKYTTKKSINIGDLWEKEKF